MRNFASGKNDAALDYIEHALLRIGDERVFLTSRAPYRPFTSRNAITEHP